MKEDKFFEKYKKMIDDIKFNMPKFDVPNWQQFPQVSDSPMPTDNVSWESVYTLEKK